MGTIGNSDGKNPGIIVPFPGARGIKFVLEGNNKERGARDLIETYKLKPKHILFAGNEIFEGENDNMMRNIPGITLLSVAEKTDLGEQIVSGSIKISDSTITDEEIWTRWMLPEYPLELVSDRAVEFNLLFSHSKGNRKFRSEAYGIIRELYSRGYKIGIVSNTVSRVLVPGEIEETGLAEYIDVLIMSSITNVRKPNPKMFRMAAEIMHVKPEHSVYVGDKPGGGTRPYAASRHYY